MLGLSIPDVAYRNTSSLAARVAAMFRNSEQGVWYDPSDITTLYQDAAGTTPVTAMEQPVGLILDKSKGLVLGPELVTNGDFSAGITGWTPGNAGQSVLTWEAGKIRISRVNSGDTYPNARTPLTGLTAGRTYKIVSTTNNPFGIEAYHAIAGIPASLVRTTATLRTMECVFTATATTHKLDVGILSASGAVGQYVEFDNISVRELPGNHAYQTTSASRPVLSARVNQYLNTATLATQNVTTLATTYTLRFDGAGSITLSGTATGTYTAGAHSVVCTAGTLTSTVTGMVTNADLRPTNSGVNLPPYQRVGASTDYDTAGFPTYLKFDGIDDYLVTNSIDFTGTDKMTVCAGVRYLGSADGAISELSADRNTNNGSFTLSVLATVRWFFASKGTVSQTAVAEVSGPYINHVLTGLGAIAGGRAVLRSDSVAVNTNPYNQGTGNYGNYPLYIGSRAGTSMRYNGHIYSLIVRGAQSSYAQIASVERYVNGKTKAYA